MLAGSSNLHTTEVADIVRDYCSRVQSIQKFAKFASQSRKSEMIAELESLQLEACCCIVPFSDLLRLCITTKELIRDGRLHIN